MLRKKKEISDNQDTLENERKILKFLEHNEIDSVPKSVKYDSKQSINIISFVGKEEVTVNNLELQELTKWTQNLAEIHKLTFKEYKEFCRQENFSFEKPKKPDKKLESIEKDFEEELQKTKTMRHVFNITWCLKRAEKTEDKGKRQRYLEFAKKQKVEEK